MEDRQQEDSSFKWRVVADTGTIPCEQASVAPVTLSGCPRSQSFKAQCMHRLPPLDFSPTVTIVDTQKIAGENSTCLGQGTAEVMPARHSAETVLKNSPLEAAWSLIIPTSATNPKLLLDDIKGKQKNKT